MSDPKKCERCGAPCAEWHRFCGLPCILNVQAEHAPELAAQIDLRDATIAKLRSAAQAVIDALTKCDVPGCGKTAIAQTVRGNRRCAGCASEFALELPESVPLRALLALLKGDEDE